VPPSPIQGGIIQWTSPELLDPERFGFKRSRPTKESDCYALGMTVYEVLSGRTPFSPSVPSAVIWKVLGGERPQRPQGEEERPFTEAIWRLLEDCWKPQPSDRVSVRAVLSCLEESPHSARLPSDVGSRLGVDGGDRLDAMLNDSGVCSRFNSALPLVIPPII